MLSRACAVLAAAAALIGAAGPAVAAESGIGQQVRAQELPELQAIGATSAWPVSRGAGVTVGVLDTGVDGSATSRDRCGPART